MAANEAPKKGGIFRAYLNFNVLYKILIGLVIGAIVIEPTVGQNQMRRQRQKIPRETQELLSGAITACTPVDDRNSVSAQFPKPSTPRAKRTEILVGC